MPFVALLDRLWKSRLKVLEFVCRSPCQDCQLPYCMYIGIANDLLRDYDPLYRLLDVCPLVLPISWSPNTFLYNLFRLSLGLTFWLSWWLGLFLVRGHISVLPPTSFDDVSSSTSSSALPFCNVWKSFRPHVSLLLNLKLLSNLKVEKKRSETRSEYSLFSLGFLISWWNDCLFWKFSRASLLIVNTL